MLPITRLVAVAVVAGVFVVGCGYVNEDDYIGWENRIGEVRNVYGKTYSSPNGKWSYSVGVPVVQHETAEYVHGSWTNTRNGTADTALRGRKNRAAYLAGDVEYTEEVQRHEFSYVVFPLDIQNMTDDYMHPFSMYDSRDEDEHGNKTPWREELEDVWDEVFRKRFKPVEWGALIIGELEYDEWNSSGELVVVTHLLYPSICPDRFAKLDVGNLAYNKVGRRASRSVVMCWVSDETLPDTLDYVAFIDRKERRLNWYSEHVPRVVKLDTGH